MPRNPFVYPMLIALLFLLIACSSTSPEEPEEPLIQATAETAATQSAPAAVGPSTLELEVTTVPVAETTPYPGPAIDVSPTPTPASYPPANDAVESNAVPVEGAAIDSSNDVFLPFAGGAPDTPAAPPTATPAPLPTVNFAAVQAELQAQGQELAFVKTGFHVTLHEDREVLDDWMTRLDEAGVPFFLKTVDNAEPLFKAQELKRESGVPHVLVYRASGSVPHYELPPQEAAQHHWTTHRDLFPPELDPNLVWVETLNEPDRMQSEWLAQFALETARLAMADGFRWAAFGFAAGEPEPEHWRGPSMQEFLRLAGENPEQVAVALHEYSYIEDDIGHEYPYKIGRFQALFEAADALGVPRPTVLITEWGWEHADIPPADQVIQDVNWASKLYAAYPQVKGAAIWNLGIGCCFGDISEQVQEIIDPLTEFSLRNYYSYVPEQQAINAAQFQP